MFNANVAGGSVARAVLLGTSAITLLGAPSGVAMARVGVTSATAGDPLGKPPTEAERVLRIGIDVQANELITTKANDRAHLVFLDGTSLTVGPDAQLTIDKFVYDPATKKGDLAINATKGVFRLVGGKISKSNPITITTPSATIGIRGGITMFTVRPSSTTSTFIFGSGMTLTAAGQTQTVTRPGSQVTASGGAAPGAPTMVAQGGLSGQTTGGGTTASGTTGGSTNNASADQMAQSSGFSNNNSNQTPAAIQPPTDTPVTLAAVTKSNDTNTVTNALTNNQTEQQQQAIEQQTPPPPPPPPGTTVIVTQGRLLADPTYASFNNATLAAPRTPANNQALAASGTTLNGLATITTSDGRTMQVPWLPGRGFNFTADTPFGTNLAATGVVSPTQDFFAYVFTGSDGKKTAVFGGAPTSTVNLPKTGFAAHTLTNASGVAGNLPFADSTVGGDAALKAAANNSPLYSAYAQTLGVPIPPFGVPNERATSLQVSVSISGQGAAQKSYTGAYIGTYFADYNTNSVMNSGGYSASYRMGAEEKIGRLTSSIATADTPQGNAIYGPSGDYMVYLPDGARSTVAGGVGTTVRTEQAALNQPYTNLNGSDYYPVTLATKTSSIAVAPDLGQSRTTQTQYGYVGGVIEAGNGSGGFSTRVINANEVSPTNVSISTDAATNRAQATIKVSNFGTSPNVIATFELGSLTGPSLSSSAFVDDRRYGLRDRVEDPNRFSKVTTVPGGVDTAINSRTFLASYDSAPVTLPGATTCTDCSFMSWGWWSGDIRYDNEGFRQGQRDRLHMATYVVGKLTNAVQLPLTGTATYSGHAFGNVVNGPNSYVAGGSYTNAWNFATQRGHVTIGNFDGATYTGQTALRAGTVNFTGPLAGAGRTGSLSGSFFQSPTDPVAGQGGSFAVTGPGYKAGGTFIGKK
jgi:hypothetical protein